MLGAAWSRSDTYALIIITVFAGLLRLIGLGSPAEIVFDESYYAQDGCWYATRSEPLCGQDGERTPHHPPLAKWLIAAGIAVFGYTPFGWRIAPWGIGTLSVPLLYLLARRVLRSTTGASIAAGLLAVDFLHIVHSRVAMLDIFVATFSLTAFLCTVYDRDSSTRGLWRPWRFAAGVAAGMAAASKWSGLTALAGVIALTVWWEARGAADRPAAARARAVLSSILLPLVAVPALVYTASHIGWVEGQVFAPPWDRRSWLFDFLRRQWRTVKFHTLRFPLHPYQSPPWSWLLLRRPVVYFWQESGDSLREILAMGNPLAWWPALAALGLAAARWIRGRSDADTVILAGFAATYLPWLLFNRVRTFVFLFYVLPAVPFLCLALARAALSALARPWGKAASAALAAGILALVPFFYPVLTARPLSYDAWRARVWFRDCGPLGTPGGGRLEGTRHLPARIPGRPPTGWCWL